MQLIVMIPAYNEAADIAEVIREIPRTINGVDAVRVLVVDDGSTDETVDEATRGGADWVVRNPRNMGLAYTFQRALFEAVKLGADVIVNTDGDNHYDQTAIPGLIEPILGGRADIVVGSRVLDEVAMPAANRYGNRVGNLVMQWVLGLPAIDVSTGFRAYSREAALRTVVFSSHTYTHESLLAALDQRLVVENHPVPARTVGRPSRLIKSVPRHIVSAGTTIARAYILYRPLQVYLVVGVALALIGLVPLARFLIEYFRGDGAGHTQSLVIGSVAIYLAGQVVIAGLLASAIRANRRLLQETLRHTRELVVAQSAGARADAPVHDRERRAA